MTYISKPPKPFQECNCPYCKVVEGFPVLLYKKGTHGLEYFWEIPKNGSWNVKQKLGYRKRVHNDSWDDHKDNRMKNRTVGAILREPENRFISIFRHYFTNVGARFVAGNNRFSNEYFRDLIEKTEVLDRIDIVLNNLDKIDSRMEVHHWYPQSYFMGDDTLPTTYYTMDDLTTKWNCKKENYTPENKEGAIEITLTEDQKRRIRTIYAADFKLWHDYIQPGVAK